MRELVVIDYGGGNLGSLLAALERHHAEYIVTDDADRVANADAAIFPGDGAFGATMDALHERALDRAILDLIAADRPFFGICVGMQVLFEDSAEFGSTAGLAVLAGSVSAFTIDNLDGAPRIPHMGWNRLERIKDHPFVEGLDDDDYAYFLHSFRVPVGVSTVVATTHGDRFSSVVAQRNVMGTQFHPEKSQRTGDKLLTNFLRIVQGAETP